MSDDDSNDDDEYKSDSDSEKEKAKGKKDQSPSNNTRGKKDRKRKASGQGGGKSDPKKGRKKQLMLDRIIADIDCSDKEQRKAEAMKAATGENCVLCPPWEDGKVVLKGVKKKK